MARADRDRAHLTVVDRLKQGASVICSFQRELSPSTTEKGYLNLADGKARPESYSVHYNSDRKRWLYSLSDTGGAVPSNMLDSISRKQKHIEYGYLDFPALGHHIAHSEEVRSYPATKRWVHMNRHKKNASGQVLAEALSDESIPHIARQAKYKVDEIC